MIAIAKLVLLTLVAIIGMAMSSEGRQLLDYYDDCYNGYRGWDWSRGDYYCRGRRWDHGGRWYDNGNWHNGRDGF